MTLTPDVIFSRMDAGRAYAARCADTGQTVPESVQADPFSPKHAAAQYSATFSRGSVTAAEPPVPPAQPADMENRQPVARRESDRPQRPRCGAYSQLMASHDRMGTRHLGR